MNGVPATGQRSRAYRCGKIVGETIVTLSLALFGYAYGYEKGQTQAWDELRALVEHVDTKATGK